MSMQNGAILRADADAFGGIPGMHDAAPMPAQGNRLIPRFFIEAIPDPVATEREGHVVYKDQERVEILIAGDTKTGLVKKVTDEHRQQFPQHYAAFKKGREMATTGTPLEMWPLLTPAQVRTYKALNIFSVQDFAGLHDTQLQALGMGARELQKKAQVWLESAWDKAAQTRHVAELERERQASAAKDQTIADLAARIEALEKDGGGKRKAA